MKSTSKLLTNQKTLTILMIFLTVIESLGRVASSLTLAPLTDQLIYENLRETRPEVFLVSGHCHLLVFESKFIAKFVSVIHR
ncbi:hypothetical protein FAM18172_00180 [Lacticaseibacillus paracasei]|uniref:Uncharacterized protein n=1 Tax=Lacticaseibacillus paracasei TaxID=1597 RepID=A0A422MEA6_LACPA|nr:hypothetical protein FAM18172_00180 [Lacticaseibacillus paracasei]